MLESMIRELNDTRTILRQLRIRSRQLKAALTPPLHSAAAGGSADEVGALIRDGAVPDIRGNNGATPLMIAAARGRGAIPVIKVLLAAGADVEAQDYRGWTPLMYAAAAGSPDSVSLLVRSGSALEAVSLLGFTPLKLAALTNGDRVRVLLRLAADPDTVDASGLTALHVAAAEGKRKAVRHLLAAGADHAVTDMYGLSPLKVVLDGRDVELMQMLIAAGADPAEAGLTGPEALLSAVWSGDPAMVATLLGVGAEPVPAEGSGHTSPLREAVRGGRLDIVQLFIDHGADLTGDTGPGSPLLHVAAEEGHGELISLLLSLGADVNSLDAQGHTVLRQSLWHGQTAIFHQLLDAGAEPRGGKEHHDHALFFACRTKLPPETLAVVLENTPAVDDSGIPLLLLTWKLPLCATLQWLEELLRRGHDVNATDETGSTLAMKMCDSWLPSDKRPHEPVDPEYEEFDEHLIQALELVLDAGIDVNAKNRDGWTALHFAAASYFSSGVHRLILAGADKNVLTEDGESPRDLYVASDYAQEIAGLLAERIDPDGVAGERYAEDFFELDDMLR